jgi:hypothetical protein
MAEHDIAAHLDSLAKSLLAGRRVAAVVTFSAKHGLVLDAWTLDSATPQKRSWVLPASAPKIDLERYVRVRLTEFLKATDAGSAG